MYISTHILYATPTAAEIDQGKYAQAGLSNDIRPKFEVVQNTYNERKIDELQQIPFYWGLLHLRGFIFLIGIS